MGLKVEFDVDNIVQTLTLVGKDTQKSIFRSLKKEGKDIRDVARQFAPVDDHDLEKAIVDVANPGTFTVEVGIDPTAATAQGVPVSRYGLLMHEGLAPFGSGRYNLGKKSQAKDAGNGWVGGKFLERAFEFQKGGMLSRIAARVRRFYTSKVSGRDTDGLDEE